MELTQKTHPSGQLAVLRRLVPLVVAGIALVAAGCASNGDDIATAEEAASVSTTEVAAPTTTATPTTVAPTTVAPTTVAPTTVAPEPENVEPLFELTGELDLTTQEINDMVVFVEETMGREFNTPPKIVMQSIEEFEADLAPSDEMKAFQEANAEGTARFLQAIGHTELGPDELLANLSDLGGSTDLISGRYDPADDAVYIPEGALTGDTFNSILVHELAHALDGQYVDMQAMIETLEAQLQEEVAGEESFSIRAVIEGRATSVQTRWMMANNVVPEIPETPASFDSVPASVILGVQLPYQLGAQSIEMLGGPAETWDLFDPFPTSSEQMIFANRIGTDLPVDVVPPVAQGDVFTEGAFGADSLLLLLVGDSLMPGQADLIAAFNAIDGIGGGYSVVDGDATQSCLRVNIVGDTAEDLAEINDAVTTWANKDSVPGAERTVVVEGELLTLTSCAPFIS